MNSYTKPQAIIFDMDGVLIDSEPLWKEAEYEVFLNVGIDIKKQPIPINTTGLRIDEVVATYAHYYPWEDRTVLSVKDDIITCCIEKIMKTQPLIPGVIDALKLCQSQGLKIGLASSSPMRMIKLVIDLFELTPYFEQVGSADSLPYGKPHPDVYLNVAKALQVKPTHCISIEDSLNGMLAAKAARMKSIVIPAKEMQNEACWALADIQLDAITALSIEHLS